MTYHTNNVKSVTKSHQHGISLAMSVSALIFALSGCDSAVSNAADDASAGKTATSTTTTSVAANTTLVWSDGEKSLLQTLSITNLPEVPPDPSNQYINNSDAITLGKKLFFDPRLSETGTISCSTCHQPDRQFSDGMRVASGVKPGQRNTPSLLGVSHQQWLFWDGRKDSVWSQALEPFENTNEHNLTRVSVIQKVLGDADYYELYRSIFKDTPKHQDFTAWPSDANPNGDINALKSWKSLPIETRRKINRIYSNIGKAIAAYEATLKFPESKFDRFLEQLQKAESSVNDSDLSSKEVLSNTEQLGLKLFMGKASCISCHHSPLLSSQHFQNIGTGVRGKDMGRSQVAEAQAWDIFNCMGEYSDAPKDSCTDLKFMTKNRHELSGSFKVPGLRNVPKTAPYMHDGRFKSLEEVVEFYANPPSQRRTGHHLPEISIDQEEQKYLVEFLKTL